MVRRAGSFHWPVFLGAIFLVMLVAVVFFPVPGFQFIDYEVPGLVIRNPYVHSITYAHLRHIFTSPCPTGYYPARTLWLAVDYQLWGPTPFGYKLTNLLIHLANVLAVFWLLLRLKEPLGPAMPSVSTWHDVFPAALSAGLFAVHPVVVEPVAWVAGRGELSTALGTLACLHFHVTARGLRRRGGSSLAVWGNHAGAAACCGIACLAGVAGVVVPVLVTLWDLLAPDRPRSGAIVRSTAVLWLIGAAFILLRMAGPHGGPILGEAPLASADRLWLVLGTYWLNVKAIFWSGGSALILPPVELRGFFDAHVVLGGLSAGLTCLLMWVSKRQKAILLGLVWFLLTLGPVCQIIPQDVHLADRHLYLPLVGMAMAAVASVRYLREILDGRIATAGIVATAAAVLVVLSMAAAGQVRTWKSSITVFENCLKVAPDNALARWALSQQRDARATDSAASPRGDLDDPDALGHAAIRAATGDGRPMGDFGSAIPLARRACQLTQWNQPRYLHLLGAIYGKSAKSLADVGEFRRAASDYRIALEAKPDHLPALVQLATLLATSRDEELRNPPEAVHLARRARQLMNQPDAASLMVLAAIHAEAWEFDTAISFAEQGIELARQAGQDDLEQHLRRRLQFYQKRIPPEISRY